MKIMTLCENIVGGRNGHYDHTEGLPEVLKMRGKGDVHAQGLKKVA